MKRFIFVLQIVVLLFLAFPIEVTASISNLQPLASFYGETNSFGSCISATGDVNNDGYNDVVVGDYAFDADNTGAIYVFLGSENIQDLQYADADITIEGENDLGWFGYSLSSDGDINGDGYDDIVVGAPLYNNMSRRGRVYVFYGGSDMTYTNASQAEVIITGENDLDWFGVSVQSGGDINKDGYDDIVVGASSYDNDNDKGKVYIFFGGSLPPTIDADQADITITGDLDGHVVGNNLYSQEDLDNDGYTDVLFSSVYDSSGNANGGAYLFYGRGLFGDKMASEADVIFNGPDSDSNFSAAVSVGDVNGDELNDVMVGADYYNSGKVGKVYTFFNDSFPKQVEVASSDVIIEGESVLGYFGEPIISGVDVNNDGCGDMIAGAWLWINDSGSEFYRRGKIDIFFGTEDIDDMQVSDSNITLTGATDGTRLGLGLAASDINGDGWIEIVSHDRWTSDANRSKVNIYSLSNYSLKSIDLQSINDLEITETQVTGVALSGGIDILGVEIRLDGGEWMACNAADGAFDEEEEEFTCDITGLSGGEHTVEARFYDENMVYIPSSMYATETFNVNLSETGREMVTFFVLGMFLLMVVLLNNKSPSKGGQAMTK
jgi:hypothetical protein